MKKSTLFIIIFYISDPFSIFGEMLHFTTPESVDNFFENPNKAIGEIISNPEFIQSEMMGPALYARGLKKLP